MRIRIHYMRKQRFKGSIAEGQDGFSSGIKLEPAFLAEHQEALLAAGYVKQFGGGKTGRWGKCNSNSDRHHGQAKQNSKKLNPVGPNGKVLTCKWCGSYRHFVAGCPHNIDENNCETNGRDELIQM